MRRFAKDIHDDQNYDSFLDIVANLVGILVILIMVIGVRARQVVSTVAVEPVVPVAAQSPAPAPTIPVAPAPDVEVPSGPTAAEIAHAIQREKSVAQNLHSDIHKVAMNAEQIAHSAAAKAEERNKLQLAISMAETALEKRRQALGLNEQVQLTVARELESGRVELARLQQQIKSVESAVGETETIKNRPTPMAKLVFGNEEHFRLEAGRLVHVPITEMVGELTRDARNNRWKLENTDTITELLGPRNGFMMKYTFGRARRKIDTPDGQRVVSLLELKRFAMVPQSSGLGETVDVALASGSKFEQQLARFRPDETTITLWTYPDSYAEFRRVKEYIYQKGFVTAAMPVTTGYPIAGGPNGSTSAAQ